MLATVEAVCTLSWSPVDFYYSYLGYVGGDPTKVFFFFKLRNVQIYPTAVQVIPYAPVPSCRPIQYGLITRNQSTFKQELIIWLRLCSYHILLICLFWFNVAFNNVLVISRWCLVVKGAQCSLLQCCLTEVSP